MEQTSCWRALQDATLAVLKAKFTQHSSIHGVDKDADYQFTTSQRN